MNTKTKIKFELRENELSVNNGEFRISYSELTGTWDIWGYLPPEFSWERWSCNSLNESIKQITAYLKYRHQNELCL